MTEAIFQDPGLAKGRFVVIHEEGFNEVDDKALGRDWYLSEGSHFDHVPCVIPRTSIRISCENKSSDAMRAKPPSGYGLGVDRRNADGMPRRLADK